jgi:hypothetical protein
MNASQKTTETTGIVRWEFQKKIAADDSVASVTVRGVDNSGTVVVETAYTASMSGEVEATNTIPEQAMLQVDSAGNVVSNSFPNTHNTQPFIEAFQADMQDPSLAVPYDCLNDWLVAVSTCGSAIAGCFFTAGWGCALLGGLGALGCIAALRQAGQDGCIDHCYGYNPRSCPVGHLRLICSHYGCFKECCP